MEERFASQPCDTISFRGKDWEINLQTFEEDSTIPTSSQEGWIITVVVQTLVIMPQLKACVCPNSRLWTILHQSMECFDT